MSRVGRLLTIAWRIARSNVTELKHPYRLTFAVTNRCQARCAMCGIWQKDSVDELSLEEIDAIFAHANRFSWINLTGGELFRRADATELILTVIRRSRDLCLLNFPTNGYQTDDIVNAVDRILSTTAVPRLLVSISLDGPPELHDRIRGLPGCWERAVATFSRLRERRSRRFSVYFGYTMQQANLEAFDETLAACRGALGTLWEDELHLNLAHVSELYYGNAGFSGTPEPAAAMRMLERAVAVRRGRAWEPVRYVERRYQRLARTYLSTGRTPILCQAATVSCFVDPTGNLYPCSSFTAPLGSLRENGYDLHRLWSKPERQRLRNLIRTGACPQCWTPCEAYQSLLAEMLPWRRRWKP